MGLDYSRMSKDAANPTARKDIGRWLDQTFKAPNDITNGKLYYDGIMGSTKVFILSNLSTMPNATPNSVTGGTFDTSRFFRITISFKGDPLDVVLEDIGLKWGQHKGMYNGKMTAAYMGYVVAGVVSTKLNPNNYAEMAQMLA